MIVLGNDEFAVAMKLAGMKESYVIRKREDAIDILKNIDKDELIIANVSIIKMLPELEEFKNVVGIPDNANDFAKTDDLQDIIKSAVGIEINI